MDGIGMQQRTNWDGKGSVATTIWIRIGPQWYWIEIGMPHQNINSDGHWQEDKILVK